MAMRLNGKLITPAEGKPFVDLCVAIQKAAFDLNPEELDFYSSLIWVYHKHMKSNGHSPEDMVEFFRKCLVAFETADILSEKRRN